MAACVQAAQISPTSGCHNLVCRLCGFAGRSGTEWTPLVLGVGEDLGQLFVVLLDRVILVQVLEHVRQFTDLCHGLV